MLSMRNRRVLRYDGAERLRMHSQPTGLYSSTSSFFQEQITRDKQLSAKASDTFGMRRNLYHAHLTWVDLWTPRRILDPSEQSAVMLMPHEEKVKLPSLRGVRLLDMSLFPFSGARTPLLIPPDMVGNTESVIWSYSSLDLRHDPGLLYRKGTDEVDDVLAESLEHRL